MEFLTRSCYNTIRVHGGMGVSILAFLIRSSCVWWLIFDVVYSYEGKVDLDGVVKSRSSDLDVDLRSHTDLVGW